MSERLTGFEVLAELHLSVDLSLGAKMCGSAQENRGFQAFGRSTGFEVLAELHFSVDPSLEAKMDGFAKENQRFQVCLGSQLD